MSIRFHTAFLNAYAKIEHNAEIIFTVNSQVFIAVLFDLKGTMNTVANQAAAKLIKSSESIKDEAEFEVGHRFHLPTMMIAS